MHADLGKEHSGEASRVQTSLPKPVTGFSNRQQGRTIAKTKPSIKPNKNMKTRHQRKLSPRVAARRNPTIGSRRGSAGKDPKAIRSYHFKVPNAALAELRARIKATKWP